MISAVDTLAAVRDALGEDALLEAHARHGDATAVIEASQVARHLAVLRDSASQPFNFLMDLTVVDWPEREPRFEVVYHLAAIDVDPRAQEPSRVQARLRLKARVGGDAPSLPSVCKVYPAADWMEREAWDLYGVRFNGHPDLRRILLYDGFEGHPLRKDYPKRKRQPLVGLDP